MKKESFYITTTLPYVNSVPHIGFGLEAVQSDAIARYQRLKGKDVFFLTGTDEHGTKVLRSAAQHSLTPLQFATQNSRVFKELKKVLNISFDAFIRTTDKKKHYPGAIALWKKMMERGDIYKKVYRGLYCSGCEAFLSPKDLEHGQCPIHKKEPELIEEENYFFRLSSYTKQLKQKIQSRELHIIPAIREKEILSFIDQGLDDVSFSRSREKLPWGIPVPGDETQTMYVWADALTNYISAIGYGRDKKTFEKWWPANVQVLGKDVLRFHAAIWPAMLLSAGLALPQKLFVHGFITVEGEKMSKSVGNVLYPDVLVERYGVDPLRYYLLREVSPFEDGDFSAHRFEERYTADLAHGLGNMYARICGLLSKRKEALPYDYNLMDLFIEQKIKTAREDLDEAMESFRLNSAVGVVWDLIGLGNTYIAEKKPWSLEHPDIENTKTLFSLVILLQSIAVFLEPFLPDTAQRIQKSIYIQKNGVRVISQGVLFPQRK